MDTFALIVAGGEGKRMQASQPKQFLHINGKPVLFHTIETFAKFSTNIDIVLVLPSDRLDSWKIICQESGFAINHTVVAGGKTRTQSVINGLNAIPEQGIVAIHDGVRPVFSGQLIKRCLDSAVKFGSGIASWPLIPSIRKIDGTGTKAVDRADYIEVQTPQAFQIPVIKKAYGAVQNNIFTDDASVVEATGKEVRLVAGEAGNIKITTPEDIFIAQALLNYKQY